MFAPFTDEYKLIVQRDRDGGDSCQRTPMIHYGHYLIGKADFQEFLAGVRNIEIRPGIYIRHPINYNQENDLSRDQETPLVPMLGAAGQKEKVKELLKRHIERRGLYQNGDLPTLATIGSYIRALEVGYLYPLLMVTDLGLLVQSAIERVKVLITPNDVSDALNHTVLLLQAQRLMPTPISYLARKLYKPVAQWQFNHYFRPETGAPPVHLLYRPLIEAM